MASGEWEKQAALQTPKRWPVAEQRFTAKKPKSFSFQISNPLPVKSDNLKSSLLDSLEHYVVTQSSYKKKRDDQFKFIESQLIIANKETKKLIAEKRQLANELHTAAQELERSKRVFDQLKEEKDKIADELQTTKPEIEKCKQKTEQSMKDLNTMKDEMKYLGEEKGWILKERDQIADSLQKSEQMVEYYRHKGTQLRETQTKFEKFKAVLKFAIEEKNRMSEEKDKISDELKKAREHSPKDSDTDDDAFNCLICMEPWTESHSGEHNICSLACGHFFGRSCIMKWIKQHCDGNSSKCPTCQKKATLKDLRNHYVQHISIGNGKNQ
ncbi:uncharacterized protein LOC131040326 isoform X1 [Cryptomeria japonica]|uniref:uncharacterized protein LOC131040326 isoform X1 n=1 Tax=Cryptomeria japonica TaxID=3369 RepID=UPI0027DA3237|nr:uncharacterized protein LOC131040326 isoform X1 [Cryptomeria japonica]XP_057829208.2 uncharacterized protein LOC131040326 isoform X1 [Cryptomeria japonica]